MEEAGADENDPDQSTQVVQVGEAALKAAHLPRSARTQEKSDAIFFASAMMMDLATSGLSRGPSARRGSRARHHVFDIAIIDSSGKPQLLAALEDSLGAFLVVNQEHQCSGPALVDL